MGEIMQKISAMKEKNMPLWLKANELQYDIVEENLKEFAQWLLEDEKYPVD